MATFEITVRLLAEGEWAVVAEHIADDDPLPQRAEGGLALDMPALDALALDLRGYGAALGQALFRDEVARLFEGALARAGARPLRLLLFVEDPALRRVRWERLCAYVEGDWQPLATYQRAPLSRYLPSQADRRFPPIARHDMRALVVAASPARSAEWGLPPFDEAAAVAGVMGALAEAGVPATLLCTGPGGAGPPTLDAICAEVSAGRVTVLHIVAHGRAVADGPVLYLSRPDDPGQVDPVTAGRLIDRLNDLAGPFGLPHLAFLCACESAQEEHNGSLGGLGQQLVLRLGTLAVVAMADRVSVDTVTALSSAFYGQLLAAGGEAEGAVDLALVKATAGLAERGDVSVPVLFSRLGARPLFSGAAQRAPDAREVAEALGALALLVDERAPVLAPELRRAAAVVRAHLDVPEAALSPGARAELAQARGAVEAICSEAAELTFAALATGTAPARYEGATCPFTGLAAFGEGQRRFFFGRDALVAALLERLGDGRFLAVAGPSGAGKSSAVLAGLVPALRERRPGLRLVYLTPGELPLAALERGLYEAEAEGQGDLLVVVDQLEELLLPRGEAFEAEERRPFVERLCRLAGEQLVVVVVRSDVLEQCGRYPELGALLEGRTVQVQPLGAEELRDVAERQAAAVGLRLEGGLAQLILADVRDERGAMPLAQHALRELWQRRRGRWLRAAEYVALGGVKEAIARTADQIFARHDAEAQERLREIFLRLTRLDRDPAPAGEPADTRQRVPLDELVPAGEPRERIEALLGQLGETRLVMRDRDLVEVAHEALIRSWRRLRQWLADDRQLLLQLDDLRHAAGAWARGGGAEEFLWSGGRLAQAEALAHLPRFRLNAQERAFLDAGAAARRREQEAQLAQLQQERRLRAEAEASRRLAEQEAERAREAAAAADRASALAAEARRIAEAQADSARLAREESIAARTRAEESRLRAVEEAEEAGRQRDLARREEERARQAEEGVRLRARQLRRRFWAMAALATLAVVLALVVVLQGDEARRQALVAEARAALGRGDLDGALAFAEQAPDDRRLTTVFAEVANGGARRAHGGFEGSVNAVAFSPDGTSYLAAGHDGRLQIWERTGGSAVRSYRALRGDEGAPILAAAFAAGGPVIGTEDGRLIAVGAADGQPFAARAAGEVWSLAASPDGALLLSGDSGGEAALWDVAGRRRLRTLLTAPDEGVVAVGFLEEGRAAVVATSGGAVYIYDAATWAERRSFELRRPDAPDFDGDMLPDICPLSAMAVLPLADGEQILAGCEDGALEAWTPEGTFVVEFKGHDAEILSLAPLPGGAGGFVSSSYDQTVRHWDYASRAVVGLLQGHTSEVLSLSASPEGELVLSGSFDTTARLWDVEPGLLDLSYSLSPDAPLGPVAGLAPRADGALAVADRGGALAAWGHDGTVIEVRKAPGAALALSADGRRALVQLPDDEVAFWDMATNAELSRFAVELPFGPVAALSADGALAIIARADGDSELRAADGALLHTFSVADGVVSAVAFSPDGTRALIGYLDYTLGLWSVPDGARVGDWLIGHRDQVASVAFSPDGRRALSGAWDKTALLWDLERRGPPTVLRGHLRTVSAVAFSPDGRLALTGSYDRTVRLWDAEDGLELTTLAAHRAPVTAVAFSPDGQSALTASTAGEVRRLRVLTGEALREWLRANRAAAGS